MTTGLAAIKKERIACRLHYKKISASINLPALTQVFSQLENPSILGGNTAESTTNKFSYWTAEPKQVFEFHSSQDKPFEKLQQVLDKYKLEKNPNNELPQGIFVGGWLGYFSYEFGRYIEKLPETTIDDIKMPLVRLCFYDKVICFDHTENCFWLIVLQLSEDCQTPQQKLETLEQLLAESQKIPIKQPSPADIENIDLSKIKCNMDKDYYLKAVEKIKRYIYDGIVYQVNFSQRFESDYNACPVDLYHWQNFYNPSPYAAYIDTGNYQIISASPEMFITITDRIIETKPIKGTRPRTQNKKLNTKNFDELVNNEKEQAELNMIIDLERNDIARICQPGTRFVSQPRTIEPYPTLFHAVATVQGTLGDKTNFCDILKAVFPGGSITGAPKVSSMEIIDETEPTERGVYTGSIGFLGIDGSVCLNIAIRTIIIADNKAYAQTGGGIVADSDTHAEWDETITKARALLAGINAVQNK